MHTINVGQFYGGLVGAGFWIVAAVWYLCVWPRSLRRRIDRGEIDAFDGLAKLGRAPLFGYMLLLTAMPIFFGTLNYIGVFGDWIYLPLLTVVVIGTFLVLRRIWRH
jgi:hypothetical protein